MCRHGACEAARLATPEPFRISIPSTLHIVQIVCIVEVHLAVSQQDASLQVVHGGKRTLRKKNVEMFDMRVRTQSAQVIKGAPS